MRVALVYLVEAFISMHPCFANNNDDNATQTSQSRRRFLLGTGALTAALAGCSGDDVQRANDTPTDATPTDDPSTDTFDPASSLPYGRWLTTDQSGLFFSYANLDNFPKDIVAGSGNPSDLSVDDPLALYPLLIGGAAVGVCQLSLSFTGLTQAVSPTATSDSTINEVTVANETIIAEGSFATNQLDERLVEPTDETFGIAYEQTGTDRGYDRYEAVDVPDSVSDPPSVAVTDETVIVGPDASRLDQAIAAGDGNRSRVFETDETAAELLEQAGSGDLVVGRFGSATPEQLFGDLQPDPDPQFRPHSGENVVTAVDFDASGETFESQFALAAADLGEDRRETIETSFGTAAVDGSRSVEVSDDRITAIGTYDVDQLSADPAGQELSQAAAAELVSPEALTFQYEPPRGQQFGELWVRVTEDTDAAGIRIEADSGGYTEMQPQDRSVSADDRVAVQVDPDGDSVTVFAVNAEGAAGELTTFSVPTDELSETAASEAVPADALSFSYESPDGGDLGSLTVEVVADTDAKTLVAQPQEAPGLFTDRVGSLTSEQSVDAGTTLETAVEPAGDEVVVYATVDGATGEVARWQGPN
ncbi:hypothetical protein [Natronomonas marina]|uniref:hypothetical protein n=1 Tax=Natronomonas marina TaxID=2961939 RepID=UPI0020C9CCBB|nr:hypothetical protein [Natronomonas marina]